MVPAEVPRAHVEDALGPLEVAVSRQGWSVEWRPHSLILLFRGTHPTSGEALCLAADVSGFDAIPPAWRFVNPEEPEADSPRFPTGPGPYGKSTIFHSKRRICAPFNRLAYKQEGGMHGNWNLPRWKEVKNLGATSLCEMFAVIIAHLRCSKEMH
jgi:hypothetical protein